MRQKRLGELLIEQEVLTKEQVQEILRRQAEWKLPFGAIAARLYGVDDGDIWRARALQVGPRLPIVDLRREKRSDTVLNIISRDEAIYYGILPLRSERGELVCATCQVSLPEAMAYLCATVRIPTYFVLAESAQLQEYIIKRYDLGMDKAAKVAESLSPSRPSSAASPMSTGEQGPAKPMRAERPTPIEPLRTPMGSQTEDNSSDTVSDFDFALASANDATTTPGNESGELTAIGTNVDNMLKDEQAPENGNGNGDSDGMRKKYAGKARLPFPQPKIEKQKLKSSSDSTAAGIPTQSPSNPDDWAPQSQIRFHCGHCKQRLRVAASFAKQLVRCPRCGEPSRVPNDHTDPRLVSIAAT